MTQRFDRDILANIGDTVPLEPATAVLVTDALAMLGDGEAKP